MAKQNIQGINNWKAENVKRIPLEIRKDSGILERIEAGAAKAGVKRQTYIIDAIVEKLDRDGVPFPEVTKKDSDE